MTQPRRFRLPKDIPLEEYPTPETYLEEARRLTEEARAQGIVLRVMGPIALHFYFPDHVDLYRRMERLGERVFTDIDYAAYSRHRGKIVPFFESQGYELEKRAAMISGGERHIFFGDRIPMIDVFYDRLDYNHPIDYRGRLDIHPWCVSLADLLLQKLQIVRIGDKDLKDAVLLLVAAPVGGAGEMEIDADYVAGILADDWGFYHTATGNLEKVKEVIGSIAALRDDQKAAALAKADHLLGMLEAKPKTGKWKKRAEIGTKRPWYKEVGDWD
ncbi:MAG: hypothetical protein MUE60_12480 [Candidatus Eisenbacteria bacterium]|jgi:hypothetical protein|nr:hypothetical protein [Candidatus Eisenbacteria bacterium]